MPYYEGRPPGARYPRRPPPPDWEFRDTRFEEIESDDDDDEGVVLDARALPGQRFVSDELYFDGYDLGQQRRRNNNNPASFYDEFDSRELEYRDERGMMYQAAHREKEEDLIHSALERIRRAREKGKTNVNLSEEEMEALERRRNQLPEPVRAPLASPPATPTKNTSKPKTSSRSNSSSNLANAKSRKRNSGFFGSSSPAKSNSKAKVSRSVSAEQALSSSRALITTSPSQSQELVRSQDLPRSRPGSKAPSRSASASHRRRESTPPEANTYPSYARHYPPLSNFRPESSLSNSNRSLPDDVDWYPPAASRHGRHRATSNTGYSGYLSDDLARSYAQQDPRYASLRRGPPRPVPSRAGHSDPPLQQGRKTSGLSRELDVGGESSTSRSSSSSDDDGEEDEEDESDGVQVDVLPDESGRGYAVSRAPLRAAPPRENESRRRTDRR